MNFRWPLFGAVTLLVVSVFFAGYLGAHAGSYIPLAHIYHPTLFVATGFTTQTQSFVMPTGTGWYPGEGVEILVTAEPERDNNGGFAGTTTTWRSVGTYTADPKFGSFGYIPDTKSFFMRNICGAPPQDVGKPLFMARNTARGLMAFSSGDNSLWFTFTSCPH